MPDVVGPATAHGVEPAAMLAGGQPLGGGDDDEVGRDLLLMEGPDRGDRLGDDRARGHDMDDRAAGRQRFDGLRRVDEPVAAGQHGLAPAVEAQPFLDRGRQRLVDRARGEAQVGGEPVVRVEAAADPLEQCPGHLAGEDRLVSAKAGQLDAERRRHRRLVGAAFGRQRDSRRRPDQHEARLDVERVDQRIEPARDERVVDRADRRQPLAEQLAASARTG